MFIRKKKFNKKSYYYLVENTRANGKVMQKVVRYIGKAKNLETKK